VGTVRFTEKAPAASAVMLPMPMASHRTWRRSSGVKPLPDIVYAVPGIPDDGLTETAGAARAFGAASTSMPITMIGTHHRRPACILRVGDPLQRSHFIGRRAPSLEVDRMRIRPIHPL
jgi:hypothetical protein